MCICCLVISSFVGSVVVVRNYLNSRLFFTYYVQRDMIKSKIYSFCVE